MVHMLQFDQYLPGLAWQAEKNKEPAQTTPQQNSSSIDRPAPDIFDPVHTPTDWYIEGTILPTAQCHECQNDLEAEQTLIFNTLRQEFGLAHVERLYRDVFLVNAQYVKISTTKDTQSTEYFIKSVPGVKQVGLSGKLQLHDEPILQQIGWPTTFDVAADYLDAVAARDEFCLTGKGVRVAILDTGIDYTHRIFGGPGTPDAFLAAYGLNSSSPENRQRDGLFPTSKIVDGYDFVGDSANQGVMEIRMDEDPIDYRGGHGTRVASCVLAVAPDVDLLAVKVCSVAGCPEHSVLAGISYAVQNGAQIINLSMGTPYTSSYYSVLTKAAQQAYDQGVVIVVSAGNHGNIPFVIGDFSSMNNAITVGATDTVGASDAVKGFMAGFSSRGVGESMKLKPDLSAPGGIMVAAASGTGTGVMETHGTSFSSPFATGAAAMILEQCPECSPFAIKAILMNNVDRSIRYSLESDRPAPLSWVGNGALQVKQSLSAGIWAYSVTDMQPSISLGMITAAKDTTINRTLRITKLVEEDIIVKVRPQLRDADMISALQVGPDLLSFSWSAPSGAEKDVDLVFRITASEAPTSRLTSSGRAANIPKTLDVHEFDGWVVMEYALRSNRSDTFDIALPFYSIVRKASDLVPIQSDAPTLPTSLSPGTHQISVDLFNHGVGTAQIDTYELLFASPDDPEGEEGSQLPNADFRYVGFRSLPGNRPNCDVVLEFAFHLWEKHKRLVQSQLQVHLDLDRNGSVDYILANRGQEYHATDYSECRIRQAFDWQWQCAGFAPDHSTNSATTILRACSNDLNITRNDDELIDVFFVSYGNSDERQVSDISPTITLQVPTPRLSAPSYDVPGGTHLNEMEVTVHAKLDTKNHRPLGVLLVTNAWRSENRTGAATPRSEAIAITWENVTLPQEVTIDAVEYPLALNTSGPTGNGTWAVKSEQCAPANHLRHLSYEDTSFLSSSVGVDSTPRKISTFMDDTPGSSGFRSLQACPEYEAPRSPAILVKLPVFGMLPRNVPENPSPSSTSTNSSNDTAIPSDFPSTTPTDAPSLAPSTVVPTTIWPSTSAPSSNPLILAEANERLASPTISPSTSSSWCRSHAQSLWAWLVAMLWFMSAA